MGLGIFLAINFHAFFGRFPQTIPIEVRPLGERNLTQNLSNLSTFSDFMKSLSLFYDFA